MPATNEINIVINDKKSHVYSIRGTVWVDGIAIPFTAYRKSRFDSDVLTPQSNIILDKVAVRSKSGILSKYKEKDHIKAQIKNKARGWWIDNKLWR